MDASAVVAIIAHEARRDELIDILDGDPDRIHSAVSAWETMAALCKTYRFAADVAQSTVSDFFYDVRSKLVSIGAEEARIAADAYAVYGRGRHPAGLNMGDCFAYACAKAKGARLLYQGSDFVRTDLA